MLQLLIFNSISLLLWILWTVWLRHCWALISSPALQRPFRKPHYNVYSFRNMRNCLPTMASQLEQRAGGILCGKVLTQLSQHPNSAFCSRWPQNMETRGAVWTLITSSTQHTVSIRVSALAPATGITLGKDKTLEQRRKWPWKTFLLILPHIHEVTQVPSSTPLGRHMDPEDLALRETHSGEHTHTPCGAHFHFWNGVK